MYSVQSPDTELIKGCKRGNRLAQQYLYRKYYGKMIGICMRYTGHSTEAEDVLNRAFLKVFQTINKYTHKGTLSGWIATIVFNTAIDYVRSNTKYRQVMDYNMERDTSIDPEAIAQLYATDLYNLIQQLPRTSRAVFSLYVIDGYKHREIAKMLKINLNTSKWHLATARKMLKKQVEAMELLELKRLKNS